MVSQERYHHLKLTQQSTGNYIVGNNPALVGRWITTLHDIQLLPLTSRERRLAYSGSWYFHIPPAKNRMLFSQAKYGTGFWLLIDSNALRNTYHLQHKRFPSLKNCRMSQTALINLNSTIILSEAELISFRRVLLCLTPSHEMCKPNHSWSILLTTDVP